MYWVCILFSIEIRSLSELWLSSSVVYKCKLQSLVRAETNELWGRKSKYCVRHTNTFCINFFCHRGFRRLTATFLELFIVRKGGWLCWHVLGVWLTEWCWEFRVVSTSVELLALERHLLLLNWLFWHFLGLHCLRHLMRMQTLYTFLLNCQAFLSSSPFTSSLPFRAKEGAA